MHCNWPVANLIVQNQYTKHKGTNSCLLINSWHIISMEMADICVYADCEHESPDHVHTIRRQSLPIFHCSIRKSLQTTHFFLFYPYEVKTYICMCIQHINYIDKFSFVKTVFLAMCFIQKKVWKLLKKHPLFIWLFIIKVFFFRIRNRTKNINCLQEQRTV